MNCWLLAQHTGTVDFAGCCKSGSAAVSSGAAAESARPVQQCPPPLIVQFVIFSTPFVCRLYLV